MENRHWDVLNQLIVLNLIGYKELLTQCLSEGIRQFNNVLYSKYGFK